MPIEHVLDLPWSNPLAWFCVGQKYPFVAVMPCIQVLTATTVRLSEATYEIRIGGAISRPLFLPGAPGGFKYLQHP